MNIFSNLFGVFKQRGLVSMFKEGRSLFGFLVAGLIASVLGAMFYGFAMGIGLGVETAVKDAVKFGLIVFLTFILVLPIFLLSYRFLGRDERPDQVAAVPLTFLATSALLLAVAAPIVFLLSMLAGYSPDAIYIHLVFVDIALLVGFYVAGMLIYHGLPEPSRAIVPNIIGFIMLIMILVVLALFFSPFLMPSTTFSVGTDRIQDGLGMGVVEKVDNALIAASAAERQEFRYQSANENGDLVRDYSVTRIGDDYHIVIHAHTVEGDSPRFNENIWIIGGRYFTDTNDARVEEVSSEDLTSILDTAAPSAVFNIPAEVHNGNWRAISGRDQYTATGTSPSLARAIAILDSATSRLENLKIGSAEQGLHPEIRVIEISPAEINRDELRASLNRARVLGDVDRSDAAMQDYVQEDTFFVVRYPRTWRARTWNRELQTIEFVLLCGSDDGCPALEVSVYDIVEGAGPKQYADDLADSLSFQPEYREILATTRSLGGEQIGVVEYLYDRTVKGDIETTQHLEYIFEGEQSRYHLNFSSPDRTFNAHRSIFEHMAGLFTYLRAEG